MTDFALAPRRRRLWPVFVAPGLLLLAAVGWSAFWFYTAAGVDQSVDAWRASEAAAGRAYDCGQRSVAGFPFRLEVRCADVSVALASQTAAQAETGAPIIARLGEILVLGQIYSPGLLIAEFKGPASIAERGQPASLTANWVTARSSVVGLPGPPQRVSLVFDDAALDRLAGPVQTPLARAHHAELHGRLAEGSAPGQPLIETDLQLVGASVQEVHPLLAESFDARLRTLLSGLKDFAPKPWPVRFREIQAAGGRIEFKDARIAQGEMVAIATGSLGLTATGNVDGELQITAAGIDKVVAQLGIDKMLEQGVPQATLDRIAPGVRARDINSLMGALDRAIPGLGNAVRKNANVGVAAGISALGKEAVLEGKPARTFPLRFVEGAVLLGPLKVAQVPPLF